MSFIFTNGCLMFEFFPYIKVGSSSFGSGSGSGCFSIAAFSFDGGVALLNCLTSVFFSGLLFAAFLGVAFFLKPELPLYSSLIFTDSLALASPTAFYKLPL